MRRINNKKGKLSLVNEIDLMHILQIEKKKRIYKHQNRKQIPNKEAFFDESRKREHFGVKAKVKR